MDTRLSSAQLMSEKASSVLQNLEMEMQPSQGRTHVSSTGGLHCQLVWITSILVDLKSFTL